MIAPGLGWKRVAGAAWLALAMGAASCAGGQRAVVPPGSPQAPKRGPALDNRFIAAPVDGTPTVVDFWATYCKPCERVMKELQKLMEKYPGRLVVIGVAMDDNPVLAARKLKQLGVEYPSVLEARTKEVPQGVWHKHFAAGENLPQTLVFDAQARKVCHLQGGGPSALAELGECVGRAMRP